MMHFSGVTFVLAIVAIAFNLAHQVSADGKCKETALAITTLAECVDKVTSGKMSWTDLINMDDSEDKTQIFIGSFICLLQEHNVLDNDFILNEEGTIASIDLFVDANDETKEKIKLGYKACFYGFQGLQTETKSVLECTGLMNDWACGKPVKCQPGQANTKYYCKISNKFIQNIQECEKKHETKEDRDMCNLMKTGLIDDSYNLDLEKLHQFYKEDIYSGNETVQAKLSAMVDMCVEQHEDEEYQPIKVLHTLGCTFQNSDKICNDRDVPSDVPSSDAIIPENMKVEMDDVLPDVPEDLAESK